MAKGSDRAASERPRAPLAAAKRLAKTTSRIEWLREAKRLLRTEGAETVLSYAVTASVGATFRARPASAIVKNRAPSSPSIADLIPSR